MIIYKYLSTVRIDILERCLIRFTQPGCFNDPFETFPYFRSFLAQNKAKVLAEDLWEDFLQDDLIEKLPHLLQVLKDQSLMIEALDRVGKWFRYNISKVFAFEVPGIREEIGKKMMEHFNSRLGILSLSADPDILLMWAHYAADHTGFLIGFDSTHEYFKNELEARRITRYFGKVRYSESRPHIIIATEKGDKDSGEQFLFDVFLTKSKHWHYEKEWRLIRELENANKVIENGTSPICLFQFPTKLVKEVIVGCRTSKDDRERICNILREPDYSHVVHRQAFLDNTQFRLKLKILEAI